MILWLMSALVASTVARVNDKKMNVDRMTDQALWQAVDSCFERSLPRSAEPYLAEIKRRASDQKDMRAMMKAIDKEIGIQNYIRSEVRRTRQKDYDNEFRLATYRNEKEMLAAIGTLEENSFVMQIDAETGDALERLENLRKRI